MRWMVAFFVGLLMAAAPALADIEGVEESDDEGVAGVNLQPVRAGRLEVTPILTMRFSGGNLVYRGGVAIAYSLNRYHQLGGSFVAGNRVLDRLADRDVPELAQNETTYNPRGRYLSVDEGFGSSVSGFYRLNVPIQVEKRTFPFAEVFAARDMWGWGDVSEVGGGVGVRKVMSRRTALTTQYAYSVLFADGERIGRHVVTAGVSMFFR